jgi:hypothetical protein
VRPRWHGTSGCKPNDAASPAPSRNPPTRCPIFAAIAARDEEQLSAAEARQRSHSDADHLGQLWVKWQDNTRRLSAGRFTDAVQALLPQHEADEVLADTDDLFRALRAAELAGRDGQATLRTAVLQGDFTGARSKPAVLAARVRRLAEGLPPKHAEPWASQVPQTADPATNRFLGNLAAAMDDRQARAAQHAADHELLWAIQALGPVPGEDGRRQWEQAAGTIAAYREIAGWNHPGQALGPEPGTTSPELRALWHQALAAMTRSDGVNAPGSPTGSSWPSGAPSNAKPPVRPGTPPTSCG